MSRGTIVVFFMVLALAGGAAIALVWWSLADKFFPGAARSTGQGGPRRPDESVKPTVVEGFGAAEPPSESSKAAHQQSSK